MSEEQVEVKQMEAGEMELRKTFEEVTKNNVQATIDFSNETRKMFRDLEDKVKHLEKVIINQNNLIEGFRGQLANVQATLYAGGTAGTVGPTQKIDG